MRIDIISLFPEFIEAFFQHSIIGRARAAGLLDLDVTNPRNFTYDRHHMVDDTIYGGGCGMLMKAAPLYAAVEAVRRQVPRRRIIFMGPAGQTFDQAKARELATYDQLIYYAAIMKASIIASNRIWPTKPFPSAITSSLAANCRP